MCGIYGGTNISSQHNEKILQHRGPDANGVFKLNNVTFGQNRLSIIDISKKGTQPMRYNKSEGGSNHQYKPESNYELIITFNGEIYNYLEIKNQLVSLDYKFNTKTDTEVILAAYQEWGPKCVEKFNGMWAFSIYDLKKKVIFCSRDRFGQKPFYYREEPFHFASEIKALKNFKKDITVNKNAINFFLVLGFIPEPTTIYNEIYKLPAGHNLIYNLNTKKIDVQKYYYLPKFEPTINLEKAKSEVQSILTNAVKIRLQSDVPTAVFLSGGIDSTIISLISKELKDDISSFSITFKTKHDESYYINLATENLNIKNKQFLFEDHIFEDLINKYSEIFDEPFADFSMFPTYFLNKSVKKHATVVLSGDGGDEVFGGYPMHRISLLLTILKKIPTLFLQTINFIPSKRVQELIRLSHLETSKYYTQSNIHTRLKSKISDQWIKDKFNESLILANGSIPEAFRIFDLMYFTLPEKILTKVDRTSMANSIEVRSPFLDYRLIEISQKISTKNKVSIKNGKKILKQIYSENINPKIINRKKKGFSPPFKEWFQKQDINVQKILTELLEKKIICDDIYNQYSNKKILEEYNIRLFLLHKWLKQMGVI